MASDPRLEDLAATPNGRLQDRGIRHAIYLQRVASGLAGDLIEQLRERLHLRAENTIAAALRRARTRGQGRTVSQSAALRDALSRINRYSREAYAAARLDLQKKIAALAAEEARHQVGILRLAGGQASARVAAVSAARRPFEGASLVAHLEVERQRFVRDLQRAVQTGLALAEEDAQILARITGSPSGRGIVGRSRDRLHTVVRSGVSSAAAQARETVFEGSDAIAGVQWIATLDTRTCPICMAYDGQVFPVGEGPRPPAHLGCDGRCTTIGVIQGERPARSITYPQWLASQTAAVQREVLGRSRAALFRSGELTVDRFVSREGQVIRLDDLRAREPDAFEAAGL